MNKQLELCDFELSKLLKEIGFDWNCLNYFGYESLKDKNIEKSSFNKFKYDYNSKDYIIGTTSRPTLELAKQFFREIYNISIEISHEIHMQWFYGIVIIANQAKDYERILEDECKNTDSDFSSYNKALSEGLREACKLIINERNATRESFRKAGWKITE